MTQPSDERSDSDIDADTPRPGQLSQAVLIVAILGLIVIALVSFH